MNRRSVSQPGRCRQGTAPETPDVAAVRHALAMRGTTSDRVATQRQLNPQIGIGRRFDKEKPGAHKRRAVLFTVGSAYPDFDLVGPSRNIRERSGLQRPGLMEARASGFSAPPLVVTILPYLSPGNQQGFWKGTSSHGLQRIRATLLTSFWVSPGLVSVHSHFRHFHPTMAWGVCQSARTISL